MKPPSTAPVLQLRIHLSDGSVESFVQADEAKAQQIWDSVDPVRLFTQQRLVVAATHSKSVFVCSEIVRLDILEQCFRCWEFPGGYADVVELSAQDFRERAHLDEPALMPEREKPTPVGDLLVSFLKLNLRNHSPIHLMVEIPVKLPAESQAFMQFLLSKTALHMRLADGGVGVVNLAHLAGYTVYPGVAQVPGDSWLAEPAMKR